MSKHVKIGQVLPLVPVLPRRVPRTINPPWRQT